MNLKNYTSRLDRGAPRWKEALWILCQAVFFRPSYPLPSAWRRRLLAAWGAGMGEETVLRSGLKVNFPWRLKVGDHVWLGEDVRILSLSPVQIGSHVCISQEAFLCTGSHDYQKNGFDLLSAPIHIEDEVWIGARAFIGPGVRVGKGSVVGAAAVVTRDVPPGVLVAGNPAIVKKSLRQRI